MSIDTVCDNQVQLGVELRRVTWPLPLTYNQAFDWHLPQIVYCFVLVAHVLCRKTMRQKR